MSRVDGPAAARTLALGAWAAALWWLWLSGEAVRYVGPRTSWVVVFGAIALLAATVLQGAAVPRARPRALTPGEVLGAVALLAPLLAVLAVPSPDLGASAAARKAAPASLASLGATRDPGERRGPLTVVDVDQANQSAEFAAARGVRPGAPVRMDGFVTYRDGAPLLTRFSMFCCAADAMPSFAPLAGAIGRPREDAWLRVQGTLERRGRRLVVRVRRAQPIDAPDDPFVT